MWFVEVKCNGKWRRLGGVSTRAVAYRDVRILKASLRYDAVRARRGSLGD